MLIRFDTAEIDAIFSSLDRSHSPGVAVGIAIGGRPVYRQGFGLANVELPVALSPTIRMRIGSTTKHFTALAYLLLCEEGKAGIDDAIGTHLPGLHPVACKVTARQLMGHLGGLRDVHEISWQFSGTGRAVSSAELLALYSDIDDVNASPGTAWSYNNGGYLLLSAAIEQITRQPLEDVLRQRIFEPVGMHDTRLRRFDDDFVANSASLHVAVTAGAFKRGSMGTALAGEGGIVSTVDDMLRWLAHMDKPIVGTEATWALMRKPQTLANGISTGYGLGLIASRYRGIETIFHGGGVSGGNSQMLKVPSVGLDVVLMSNRSDAFSAVLANRILDACLAQLEAIEQPFRGLAVTGAFRSPTTGRVIQFDVRDGRQIVSIDGYDWPFNREEGGVFRPAPPWDYIKQSVTLLNDPAQPRSIRFNDFGNLDELNAIQPTDGADANALVGRYRSVATRTTATISVTEDGPTLLTVGRTGSVTYRLEPLALGVWRAKSGTAIPWDGILSFTAHQDAFHFSSLRTQSLIFRRDV